MRYTVTKAFRPKGSGSPMAAVGSDLELSASQARVFKAVGFVKEAEPTAPPAPEAAVRAVRSYFTREVTADTEEKTVPAKKTTRRYTRRDLTAE